MCHQKQNAQKVFPLQPVNDYQFKAYSFVKMLHL